MITIRKPSIIESGDKVRIQNTIDVDGKCEQLWFEVDAEYAEFLCPERADAYVIGLLHFAMLHQHDITCEVPVGEELHYQISTYLIPSLADHSKVLYPTKIFARSGLSRDREKVKERELRKGNTPNLSAYYRNVCPVRAFIRLIEAVRFLRAINRLLLR